MWSMVARGTRAVVVVSSAHKAKIVVCVCGGMKGGMVR